MGKGPGTRARDTAATHRAARARASAARRPMTSQERIGAEGLHAPDAAGRPGVKAGGKSSKRDDGQAAAAPGSASCDRLSAHSLEAAASRASGMPPAASGGDRCHQLQNYAGPCRGPR